MIDSLQLPPVALSPASTSVVHKSRSRGPSSGSLTKKVHYSTKGTASQKLTAVVAKPQPSGHRSQEKATLGIIIDPLYVYYNG